MTFPSKEHQAALHKKVAVGGLKDLAPAELAQFHAYNYGWKRSRLGEFGESYGLDPTGAHYDAHLAEQVVEFYCRLAGRKYRRPASLNHPEPTSAQAAHVEDCMRQITANLARVEERSQRVFAEDREALRRVREGLGVAAAEAEDPL
jgi:hypothetical protein